LNQTVLPFIQIGFHSKGPNGRPVLGFVNLLYINSSPELWTISSEKVSETVLSFGEEFSFIHRIGCEGYRRTEATNCFGLFQSRKIKVKELTICRSNDGS
jgi:hypothetical protein